METTIEVNPKDAFFSPRVALQTCLSEFMHDAICETRTVNRRDCYKVEVRGLVDLEDGSENGFENRTLRGNKQKVIKPTLENEIERIDEKKRWRDYYSMLKRIGHRLS